MHRHFKLYGAVLASLLLITPLTAQTAHITRPVDETAAVVIMGNVHPLALQAAATGASSPVDDSTPMEHMILHLKSDSTQQAKLTDLLAKQNDPSSPLYHHYLTPKDFGSQFGPASSDISQITAWLQSHGFKVEQVTPGGRSLVFSGTAGQVTNAFKTQIHTFTAAGQQHIGNISDPQIPAALASVVGGIVQLHDFQVGHKTTKMTPLPAATLAHPEYTTASGHYLAPADFSSIYDVNSLYSSGIDGTGQSIAIVARADVHTADVDSFRSTFGLTANDPQSIYVTNDPGMQAGGNSFEATLDTEWAGAVAPRATIKLVIGQCTNTSDGIVQAETYAVTNNVAPIISVSYGLCEAMMGSSYAQYMNSLWEQAAAQGQTVLVSSGDTGAAGCSSQASTSATSAGVNGLCSSPYATCVGGSQFVEGTNPGQYWLPGNSASEGSAISYIPETAWNESALNGGYGLIATGGGASIYFGKPSWQAGVGVPADGHRDVPDVSLSAAQHDGYAVFEYEGGLQYGGGTSFATPAFAGLMALVNQKVGTRQGLVNPVLYTLAAKQATGGAAVFHDITTGNNSVPGLTGFSAATGYDMATGLGSVDAAVMVNHWSDGLATISLSASSGSLAVNAGQSLKTTINASSTLNSVVLLAASGAPSGVTVTFAPSSIAAPGSGSTVMNVSAASTAKPGSYTLLITATSGGQAATLTLPLAIGSPSFTMAASKANVIASLPSSSAITISTIAQTGFSSALTFTVSGAPAGVTASLSAKTLAAPGTGSVVLTIAVATNTYPSTYQISVTASGGGQTQTTNISLQIPSFTVTAPSGTYKTSAGTSVTFPVTITPQPGFASTINLLSRANYLPPGITASFSPATVPGNATSTATVTLTVAKTVASGAYPFFIDGTGGYITNGAYEWLLVGIQGSCSLAFWDSTFQTNNLKVTAGQSITGEEECIWPQGTLTAPLTVSFSGVPAGLTVQPNGALKGDGNPVGVTITAAQSLAPGTYPMSITAVTSDGYSRSYPFSVAVTGNSFTLSGSQNAISIPQGTTASTSITTLHNGIFNSAINLSWSGLPTGVSASLAKSSTAAPGDGTVATTFTASSTATPGTYTATVTATGGGITRTQPLSITVAPPSCTLASSASSLSLFAGQSGSIQLSCGSMQGTFAKPLSLSVIGAPTGTTATVPSTFLPGSTAAVQITTPVAFAATSYSLSITAVSGSYSATVPLTVNIAASNFTIAGAQNSLSIIDGNAGIGSATLTHHGAFNSAVSLAWTGLPTGVTATLSKASMAAPGDGTVATTFSVLSSVTPGNYAVLLTAAGGGVTQTLPLTITVTPVPSLNLNVGYPVSPAQIRAGTSQQIAVWPSAIQGNFPAPLTVSLTGVPVGLTASLSSTTMPITGGSISVNVTAAQIIDVTNINMTLTVTSGSFTKSVPISLLVNAVNFVFSAAQSSITIKRGGASSQLSTTTTHIYGYNWGNFFAWSGLPGGVTASLSQSSIPAPGDGTVVTTFTAASTAKPGTYTANITATGGAGTSHIIPVTLIITN